MRIKTTKIGLNFFDLDFWCHACNYKGETACLRGRCCNPETKKYQQKVENLWAAWHKAGSKGKYPIMPTPTVECEKCQYADLTIGSYQGMASLRTICRHTEGTIPVPLKGRKKIWIDNVNQKQLDSLLDDIDSDIEAFAITGSPTIKDFTYLERFPNLKYVYIWWNNKATSLWDFTKTPNIECLRLDQTNKLTDISQLQNAKKLRYLHLWGNYKELESLKSLAYHPSLEYIYLSMVVEDMDMRPLVTIPNLKYLRCHYNLFEIESYAMFEARRPDVDTDFYEGLDEDNSDDVVSKPYFVGLVGKGQGTVEFKNKAKQEKHRAKYLALKEKYATVDFIPTPRQTKK